MGAEGNIKWLLIALTTIILSKGCYKEVPIVESPDPRLDNRILRFDNICAFVDETRNFLLYSISKNVIDSFKPSVEFGAYNSVQFNGEELVNGQTNEIGRIVANHPYQVVARTAHKTDTFNLIFTTLPVMRIMTEESIQDEPKVASLMELQYVDQDNNIQNTQLFESHAGIEFRGKSSMVYDKKAYGIELWDNKYGVDRSAPLLGMRYSEDWILDAMYIDNLRMRNKISFELWEKMACIPPEDQMDNVYPGIRFKYVELFINNRYEGLYCLGEKLDEKIIRFSYNQSEKGGVIYKAISWASGSVTFDTYHSDPGISMIWDGWEQVYPDKFVDWEPLADLRKFVVRSENDVFKAEIGNQIDLESAAQYYLFMNVLLAYDNVGKNIYYARYTDQSRFFIMPWDLEASWGKTWQGYNSKTVGILSNHLYDRLMELDVAEFNDLLEQKWKDYRETIFSKDSLMAPITNYYTLLKESGAIDRDADRWNLPIDFDREYAYISDWLSDRLIYLDDHFD